MNLRNLFGLERGLFELQRGHFTYKMGVSRFLGTILAIRAGAPKPFSPPWSKSWMFHCINHQRPSFLATIGLWELYQQATESIPKSCVLPNHIDVNVIHSPQTNINVNNFFLGKTSSFATTYDSRLSARQSITQFVIFLPLRVKV